MMTFHVDRDAWEARLRDGFKRVPADWADNPVLACQFRAAEVVVQFALFIADEINRGTPAQTLLEGVSGLLGSLADNLSQNFHSPDERLEEILDIIVEHAREHASTMTTTRTMSSWWIGRT